MTGINAYNLDLTKSNLSSNQCEYIDGNEAHLTEVYNKFVNIDDAKEIFLQFSNSYFKINNYSSIHYGCLPLCGTASFAIPFPLLPVAANDSAKINAGSAMRMLKG